jgi:serine/threonine-protein kinase
MDGDAKAKRRKKLLIYALVGVLVFVFIVLPAALLTGLWITERQKRADEPPRVRVPNVVGRDYKSGQAMLEAQGLKMEVLPPRLDRNQPVGVIIDQNPLAGESVEVGRSVSVSVGGKTGHRVGSPPR